MTLPDFLGDAWLSVRVDDFPLTDVVPEPEAATSPAARGGSWMETFEPADASRGRSWTETAECVVAAGGVPTSTGSGCSGTFGWFVSVDVSSICTGVVCSRLFGRFGPTSLS